METKKCSLCNKDKPITDFTTYKETKEYKSFVGIICSACWKKLKSSTNRIK